MDVKADIFLEVLENHKGIIYKIANSYCKLVEEREDLIQEIIVQLWESFDNYNKKFKYSTWIYKIALNTAISFYRKHRSHSKTRIDFSNIKESSLMVNEPLEENSNLTKLQFFIHELREMDRAIILLYLDGLSQKEISEIVGITPTNVGTKIARIKINLQKKFQTLKK